MKRCFVFLFLLWAATLSGQSFYGTMKYPDHTYHLLLEPTNETAYVIGFRPNDIPIKNFRNTTDSVVFERADFFSVYKGAWSKDRTSISGVWIGEEKDRHTLNFVLAQPDTIQGVYPRMDPHYLYKTPVAKNEFVVSRLQDEAIDEKLILSLFDDIQKKKFEFIQSLLISRNNKLVLEEYFYNMHGDVTFGIQSVTKSLVSALTGIAIEKKEISSVGDPICKYLPDYKTLACNQQNVSITLKQVMSMSTGLAWDERTYDYGDPLNSLSKASESKDVFAYLLKQPRAEKEQFSYNSLNHSLMNKVLRGATGMSNKNEIEKRLIKPLGIKAYDLGTPENGVLGDISLTSREMMKFGILYLNNGMYNGSRIIPASWVKESTTEKIKVKDNLGYGYFWWTTTFSWKEKPVQCYFAWGYGGQYIIVVPELQLVVVMTGTNWSTDPEKFMADIMANYVIPSCR